MKIKDFIKQEIDIDVCDDYDESCYMAFVGPMGLTDEGKRKFADVLNRDIDVRGDSFEGAYDAVALVHAENDAEVRALRKFFGSLAGYCAEEDYNKWFIEQ